MSKSWWILFITVLLAVWNAGIIWFVQIAVYPLWPLVDAPAFATYHVTWWHDMWPTFGPVGLMFICSVLLLVSPPGGVSKRLLWAGVLIQVAVHTLTAVYWAPIQASMATPTGMSHPKFDLLMSTHWLRVMFFFAYAALMIWIAVRTLERRIPQELR